MNVFVLVLVLAAKIDVNVDFTHKLCASLMLPPPRFFLPISLLLLFLYWYLFIWKKWKILITVVLSGTLAVLFLLLSAGANYFICLFEFFCLSGDEWLLGFLGSYFWIIFFLVMPVCLVICSFECEGKNFKILYSLNYWNSW